MFKKIHSNRDPEDTVYRELKKEFSAHFSKADHYLNSILSRYPKQAFALMVALMMVSMGLSLTVFRNKELPPINKSAQSRPRSLFAPANDGFDRILETGAALKQTIGLKRQIDSLTTKGSLTHADSIALEKALDQLQQLSGARRAPLENKKLNQNPVR
jgi:hypothetical protein